MRESSGAHLLVPQSDSHRQASWFLALMQEDGSNVVWNLQGEASYVIDLDR